MIGFRTIKLAWRPSPEQVDGYYIYRGRSPGKETAVPINKTIIKTTTYTDSAPFFGVLFYVVRSSRNGILSKPSNEVKTKRIF